MLSELKTNRKVVGLKQVRRALKEGTANRIFLADNADPQLTDPVRAQCAQRGVPVEDGFSMKELGQACGITVDAAVAALLN
mgnify:CR=1 FL=1